MADGPKLVELIGHIVLHIEAVAGDIPAAAVLCAQSDLERRNQRLHLLGDERRRFIERFALKRDIVDVDVWIEHAVAAVERLLDVHQTTARANADDRQHDGDHGAERADGRSADLTRAALFCLFAHRVRVFFLWGGRFPRGRTGFLFGFRRGGPLCPRRRALGARLALAAARLLHLQNRLGFLSAADDAFGRFRFGFLLPRSAGGRAAGIGNHPIRRVLLVAHDDAHRLLRRGRDRGSASAAGYLAIIRHGRHLLQIEKRG